MVISMKQEVKIWMKNNKIQEVQGYDFMWGRLPMQRVQDHERIIKSLI